MRQAQLSVLGPLELRLDGVPVALPGRRPAALLAMLALARGRTVSIDELALGVWGDDLPDRVRGSLQTYVGRLRRVVGEAAIITEPSGYRLDVGAVDVDLELFAAVADDPVDADPDRAAAQIDAALGLWRGMPLAGLSDWIERNDQPALVDRHLSLVERRADLWLATGDHDAAIVVLRPLVEQHPLRESLWARLLTALRHAGRVAEALEQYEDVRRRLADELGIDPSPELRAVQQALLGASDGGAPAGSQSPVPRQLPATPPLVIGRDRELARMDDLTGPDTQARIMVLHGPGGSGKTTLAVHWGYRTAAEFPDGHLIVPMRGHGPGAPVSAAMALEHLLRGLGISGPEIPTDVDQAGALVRTVLADRRALIVIDDARTVDQVRPLLPGGESVVVVTSRHELRGLVARDGAVRVPVSPLSEVDAVRMLERRLRSGRAVSASTGQLADLARLCGYLPVALAIVAERVDRGGPDGVENLIARLRDRGKRLGALSSGGDQFSDLRAVFDTSYDVLDDDTAMMYRRLGLHTDTVVSVPAAAALMGVDTGTADGLLDRLADAHLVEAQPADWFGLHDLVRDHAAEVALRVDTDADRESAVARARSWYVHTAQAAVRQFAQVPLTGIRLGSVAPGVVPQEFDDSGSALTWFERHRRSLSTMLDASMADGDVPTAVALTLRSGSYLDERGAYEERVAMFDRLASVAEAAGDDVVLAICVNARGIHHGHRGESELALRAFERVRELKAAAGDRDGELTVMLNIAAIHERAGRPDLAVELMEEVVADRTTRGGDPTVTLWSRQKLAQSYCFAGRLDEAEQAATVLLDECRRDGVQHGAARALDTLAEVSTARGRIDEVERRYTESAAIYSATGNRYEVAIVINTLAKVQFDHGRFASAEQSFRRALVIINELESTDIELLNRADIEAALATIEQARRKDAVARQDVAM